MQESFHEEPQEELKEEILSDAASRENEMYETGVPSLADNVRILSPGRMVLKRFFRSKLSMVGLVTMIILFIFSFVGPLFDFLPFIWGEQEADYSGGKVSILSQEVVYEVDGEQYVCYYVSETQHTLNNEGPISPEHLLGTDQNGYDIFSRLMYGGRVSLTVGLVVIFLETVLGVILGALQAISASGSIRSSCVSSTYSTVSRSGPSCSSSPPCSPPMKWRMSQNYTS